jgi:hypothetical protein
MKFKVKVLMMLFIFSISQTWVQAAEVWTHFEGLPIESKKTPEGYQVYIEGAAGVYYLLKKDKNFDHDVLTIQSAIRNSKAIEGEEEVTYLKLHNLVIKK